MKVAYLTHPDCLEHEMGPQHPESPYRMRAIESALETAGLLAQMARVEAPAARREDLERVHSADYLRRLEASQPQPGEYAYLDPDTSMNSHSWRAALHAAGAGIRAVDGILAGEFDRAFCNVRPPGHHAERSQAMGFCLLGNVAIAAAHALSRSDADVRRVAIVDFDVHHGNGTEDLIAPDPRVLLFSTFQHPLYPYKGADTASAHILNLPLPAGTGSDAFREQVETRVLPRLVGFAPDLVLFSAGFDAHRADPLAGMLLDEEDYGWITRRVIDVTREPSRGRVVSMLEGGYDLTALAASAVEHVRGLMEE